MAATRLRTRIAARDRIKNPKRQLQPKVVKNLRQRFLFGSGLLRGPVIGTFSGLNKGINIGGHIGDPVYADRSGPVVYSGNGLRAYGNLIIIKHNSVLFISLCL